MSRRRWLQSAATLIGLAFLSGSLSACGGSSDNAEGEVTKLTVGCEGDKMAYDQTSLAAPAGAPVELTFHNHSAFLQHNWVLVNGGDEAATAVYEAAMAAGVKSDFLPEGNPQVLVHTPLVASGKSVTISFQAPAQAGAYTYLCTFPGHFLAGMKGSLTVT